MESRKEKRGVEQKTELEEQMRWGKKRIRTNSRMRRRDERKGGERRGDEQKRPEREYEKKREKRR